MQLHCAAQKSRPASLHLGKAKGSRPGTVGVQSEPKHTPSWLVWLPFAAGLAADFLAGAFLEEVALAPVAGAFLAAFFTPVVFLATVFLAAVVVFLVAGVFLSADFLTAEHGHGQHENICTGAELADGLYHNMERVLDPSGAASNEALLAQVLRALCTDCAKLVGPPRELQAER